MTEERSGADLLDDELPPDIPDISDPAAETLLAGEDGIAIEVEPEPPSQPPQPISARRLAPPPKPARKPSASAPPLEETTPVARKPASPPGDAAVPPVFARPGAPLGAPFQTTPPAARLPVSATQPLPAQPQAPAARPLSTTQPLTTRQLSQTPPETPVARLPTPMPPQTPARGTAISESSLSSDSGRPPAEALRKVAEPPRPRSAIPRPASDPPRAGSSPALGSDRPSKPAPRSPSAPVDVRSPSGPAARQPSAPPLAASRTPSSPFDVRNPRPPPAAALPTGLGVPVRARLPPVVDFSGEPDLELDEPIVAPPPAASTSDHAPASAPMSEPKSTAILAMRIIVVNESSRVQLRSDAPPPLESSPPAPVTIEPIQAFGAGVDGAEELAEEDVAPDSEERPAVSEPPAAPQSDDPLRRPPPPPRRQTAQPTDPAISKESSDPAAQREKLEPGSERAALAPEEPGEPKASPATAPVVQRDKKETLDEAPRARQRRPWWEELFGDDFIRATKRLSQVQVIRECSFIEESLGVAAGGVVLDLGCGAGHHAVELASRGYGVVGYDLSLFQLALAADVAQEQDQRLNFLQGDMREMAFEEMFDGVYCWNTTFGYFEEEKNLAVAQRVFKALRPGGMFLLDVANRDFVVAQSPSQVWYEGEGCVCMDDMSVDFITSRLRVKRSVILDDGRTRECTYSIRLYSLHELGKLLHEVGFRVTEASGHPSMPGVFFGQSSPRLIMLAQRP